MDLKKAVYKKFHWNLFSFIYLFNLHWQSVEKDILWYWEIKHILGLVGNFKSYKS